MDDYAGLCNNCLFYLVGFSETSFFTSGACVCSVCNINYLLIMVLFKKSPGPMLSAGANNWNT